MYMSPSAKLPCSSDWKSSDMVSVTDEVGVAGAVNEHCLHTGNCEGWHDNVAPERLSAAAQFGIDLTMVTWICSLASTSKFPSGLDFMCFSRISVLATNSTALYTRLGDPARKYFSLSGVQG